MAVPRVTAAQPKQLKCRQQSDFPNFTEAVSKQVDLETQRDIADRNVQELQQSAACHKDSPVESAAQALVSGSAIAVEEIPDLQTLQREAAVLMRAVQIQAEIVTRERGTMTRAIASDLVEEHRAAIKRVIDTQNEANRAHEDLLAFRRSATQLCGQECLPPYAVNETKRLVFVTAVADFARLAQSYLKGETNA